MCYSGQMSALHSCLCPYYRFFISNSRPLLGLCNMYLFVCLSSQVNSLYKYFLIYKNNYWCFFPLIHFYFVLLMSNK